MHESAHSDAVAKSKFLNLQFAGFGWLVHSVAQILLCIMGLDVMPVNFIHLPEADHILYFSGV